MSLFTDIEEKAENVLSFSGQLSTTPNLEKLAQDCGITVDYSRPESPEISGVLYRGEPTVILINNADSPNRQRFSLAHELGHFFLHEGKEMFVDGKQVMFRSKNHHSAEEMEANAFAAALLMPKNILKKELRKFRERDIDDHVTVEKLAKIFQVSTQTMNYRLLNLGYF